MNTIDKSGIAELVLRSVKEIGQKEKNKHLINAQPNTELYGKNGYLDSLMLLRLIVDLEEKIAAETGKNILIADENTMNLISSPFQTVETLVKHIEERINQKDK